MAFAGELEQPCAALTMIQPEPFNAEATDRTSRGTYRRDPGRHATADFAGPARRDHGEVVVTDSLDEAYKLANAYASEHAQVRQEPREAPHKYAQLRSPLLGEGTCVSYGQGDREESHFPHVAPRAAPGGLWVGRFRTVTYQEFFVRGSMTCPR